MRMTKILPNYLAGVVAGRTHEFIETNKVGVSHNSGSARLMNR